MNFPTPAFAHVTNSFHLEIWFWGPTYPTYLYDVTLFSLFFLNSSLNTFSLLNFLKASMFTKINIYFI